MHLNWVLPVACSLLPASFEEFRHPNLNAEQLNALSSLWGETLISRWLKRRKFINFSKTDERALIADSQFIQTTWKSKKGIACLDSLALIYAY